MDLASLIRRPLVMTLASSSLVQALSIITGIVLARGLGPDHRGELGTVILWPGVIATLAIMGLPDAVSVLTAARALSIGDAVRSALPIIALLSGAGVVAVVAIVLVVTAGMDAQVKLAALVYVVFIPINMITLTLVGALNGSRHFGALNVVRISVSLVAAIGLPLLAVTGLLSVGTAVVTYIVANLVALGLALASLRRLSGSVGGRASRINAQRLLNFGIRTQAGVVAGMLGERLDQLAISAFLLPRQFGLYLAALALSAGTAIVSTSITTVLVPTVAATAHDLRLVAVRRYLRINALLTAGIAIVTAVATPILVPVLFGAAFQDAVLPAQILLVATVPLALSRALAAASRASGQPWRASRAEWLGLTCAVPAYAVLLPAAGLVGAAWASVVSYSASLLFQAYFARSALGARSVRDLVRKGGWEADANREGLSQPGASR